MPQPHVSAPGADAAGLAQRFASIRAEFKVPDGFDARVVAAAAAAAPESSPPVERTDARDIALRTLDPEGSRDLDQAFALSRRGSGYEIVYAIADVAAWVQPGGAIDAEAHRRGVTVYCPDRRSPLHPPSLSEGRASLLPGQDTPAVVWRVGLDQTGGTTDVRVERSTVRSRAALDYRSVQSSIDDGSADPELMLLAEIGRLRLEQEAARGGVSLTLPTQEVRRDGSTYRLEFEQSAAAEQWNAQLSLCCGMAAADLMLHAGVGIVRTLPPAPPDVLAVLQRSSRSLGVPWDDGVTYPEWVRSLDPANPRGAALMVAAARTLRGAGYVAFDGVAPSGAEHAAIAAPYAHVTAPLRRLVDRYATECAIAASSGRRPAAWVLDALAALPDSMQSATQRAGGVDRACVDLVEAAVLSSRVGDIFDGEVVAVDRNDRATVQLLDPAVITSVDAPGVAPGDSLRLALTSVDLDARHAQFAPASRQ